MHKIREEISNDIDNKMREANKEINDNIRKTNESVTQLTKDIIINITEIRGSVEVVRQQGVIATKELENRTQKNLSKQQGRKDGRKLL
jgi:hypothetical protein